jgi:pimeloyl-ACP methyl ester carboxylesterase
MRSRRIVIGILLVLVVLAGAAGIAAYRAVGTFAVAIPESLKGDRPSALVAVERIGKYPSFAVQYILNTVDLPDPIDVTHGITLYRVQYRTTNYDGSVVVASGLVALPNGNTLKSVVVYHHGTNAERRTAPSQSGLGEGVLIAAATAGTGNVLVAPDYIGLGESHAIHPYMYTRTTVSTSVDFLHAARGLVEHLRGEWPASLYLMGFSQGGHATFAVQRELEKLRDPRFEVKASAPIAGPFQVREISFPQALTGESKSHAFYLAYLANSYAHVYGRPLSSILTSSYVETIPVLFDGDHTSEKISAALPADPRELFNPEVLAAYDQGKSHWFLDALAENDVYNWTPLAPVRIYYGDDDVDVLPEEARRAEAAMKQRGADVRAVSVGPYSHGASVLRAVPQAIRWFSELDHEK